MDADTLRAYRLLRGAVGARLYDHWLMADEPRHLRLLITGSRGWQNVQAIKDVFRPWWRGGTTLVHGACPTGADQIADRVWRRSGGTVEPWPANWKRYRRAAGPKRNAAMVDAGADRDRLPAHQPRVLRHPRMHRPHQPSWYPVNDH